MPKRCLITTKGYEYDRTDCIFKSNFRGPPRQPWAFCSRHPTFALSTWLLRPVAFEAHAHLRKRAFASRVYLEVVYMKNSPGVRSRRSFLLAATAGTAATAAALMVKKGVQPRDRTDPRAGSASNYRVTEHIRSYYRTAMI